MIPPPLYSLCYFVHILFNELSSGLIQLANNNFTFAVYRSNFVVFVEYVRMRRVQMTLFSTNRHSSTIRVSTTSNKLLLAIIMHQHAIRANIIGMIILNLKVVDGDRCFQNLVLGLFQRDLLAIDQHQNVSGTEVNCGIPALMRHIEGMGGFCVPPGAPRIPRGSFLVALQRQLH